MTRYSVVHDSASAAASTTSTKVGDLAGLSTSITDAITAAEDALPPEFTIATARLSVLRQTHVDDVETVEEFAAGAVASLQECLKVYEHTSAEMVAETWALENKVAFDHSTIFTSTEDSINEAGDRRLESLNDGLPGRDEGRSGDRSFSSTQAHDGTSESVTTTRSGTRGGTTDTSSDSYSYQRQGEVTTSERTRTHAHTSDGVTDTTSYYDGTSFRGSGSGESTSSGRSYTVSDGRSATTTHGSTRVPVAR